MEEQYKQQDEAISPLLTEEGSGKETVEGTQKPILQPIPINLNLNATTKPKNSPLAVHILPSPASQSQPKTPTPKAHASPSLLVQNIRKLVTTIRAFTTTSKTLAAAHTAWHNGWFRCWFRHGAPGPGISTSFTSSNSLQRVEKLVWGELSLPHFLFLFILFYFDFFNFSF